MKKLLCKVHTYVPYVRLGTYVKMRIRTCRILASQVRRYVSRIKLYLSGRGGGAEEEGSNQS